MKKQRNRKYSTSIHMNPTRESKTSQGHTVQQHKGLKATSSYSQPTSQHVSYIMYNRYQPRKASVYCTPQTANIQYTVYIYIKGGQNIKRQSLKISINATSCNAVTVPPHDVIQNKMTPWVQLTAVGTWPHDRCGRCGYSGERPPHTVIGQVRLPGWWCAKEGKKQWDFLFLKSEFKAPFPHSHLFCLTNQMRLLRLLP